MTIKKKYTKMEYIWGYSKLFVLEKSVETSQEYKLSIFESDQTEFLSEPNKIIYGTYKDLKESAKEWAEYDS